MKKLLVLVLVLAMASLSMAGIATLRVAANDLRNDYMPSDIITLELVANFSAGSMGFNKLQQDSGVEGGASEPMLNSLWDGSLLNPGQIKNTGTDLMWAMTASLGLTSQDLPAGTVLWHFEYHIPDVPASTMIHFTFVAPSVDSGDFMDGAASIVGPSIHVIPEPMTIALLGLGGLFLRRRMA